MNVKASIIAKKTPIMKHGGVQNLCRMFGQCFVKHSEYLRKILIWFTIHGAKLRTVYKSKYNKHGKHRILESKKKNRSTRQPQICSENTLRQLRQTNVCWRFSSWQRTLILQSSITTLAEFPKCQSHLRQRCPHLTGNLKSLSWLKIFSKRVSKVIVSCLNRTQSITSILSWGQMNYRLQSFKNIKGPTRENLGDNLAVFWRKCVKPQSMATAKNKLQKLIFKPANHQLVGFLDELQKLVKGALGIAAQAIIGQFKYAKMPPHLKKVLNQAHLENGTYEQIVAHLENELELNSLEAPDELQINTVNHDTANTNADRHKPTCYHCGKPAQYRIQCRLLKRQKSYLKILKICQETKTVAPTTVYWTTTWTIITITPKTVTLRRRSWKLFIHPIRHVARQTIPQRIAIMEPMQPIDRLPGKDDRKYRIRSKTEPIKMTRMQLLRLQPKT